jgi:hypothetical protein
MVKDGWTKSREEIKDEDGKGFVVTTKRHFKLRILPTSDDCGFYRASVDSRQVMVQRFPLFLPSAIISKEIRFGETDVLLIENLDRPLRNLLSVIKHGLQVPEVLSRICLPLLAIPSRGVYDTDSWPLLPQLHAIIKLKQFFDDIGPVFLLLQTELPNAFSSVSFSGFRFASSANNINERQRKSIENLTRIKRDFEEEIQKKEKAKSDDGEADTMKIEILVRKFGLV